MATRVLPARHLGRLGKIIPEPKQQLGLGEMVTSEAARVLHAVKQQQQRKADKPKPSDDFDFQIRSRELPSFEREFMFAKQSFDRKWRFDFACHKYMVAVEIEGLVVRQINGEWICSGRHANVKGFREDCVKYATAALLGWTLLRFEQSQVKSNEAIDWTMRVLASRGWQP
jgi:very-short-patch-repair endonuclease